jgi:hypothetical protein
MMKRQLSLDFLKADTLVTPWMSEEDRRTLERDLLKIVAEEDSKLQKLLGLGVGFKRKDFGSNSAGSPQSTNL